MRAAMDRTAAAEPQPPPGWLLDNLGETDTEMFALLLEAWAGEPGSWADFPRIQAATLIICGEHEEPRAGRYARLAAQTLPRGSAVVLPGLHHLQAFCRSEPAAAAELSRHRDQGTGHTHVREAGRAAVTVTSRFPVKPQVATET
jgi:hypothetical protein